MLKGLIGYTGFIGENISKSVLFDYYFNSKNISELPKYDFDLIVCCAAPGSMVKANMNEKEDYENIKILVEILLRSKIKKIVLISTISVFAISSNKNNEDSTEFETKLGYGKNRRFLELSLYNSNIKTHIIRLPSLFGYNLKKNFLFDLLNPSPSFLSLNKFSKIAEKMEPKTRALLNRYYNVDSLNKFYILDRLKLNKSNDFKLLNYTLHNGRYSSIFFHSKESTHQFYNLRYLWNDILTILDNEIDLINISTEPIKLNEIYQNVFNEDMPDTKSNIYNENMYSSYSSIWGTPSGYMYKKENIKSEILLYLKSQKIS